MEQEVCMTKLDWVYDYTQSVWNVLRPGKKVLLNEFNVEGKPCINRESKRNELII